VWFNQLPPEQRQSGDYVIVGGDLVDVKVLGHDDMNVHQRVRGDGRISLPIIGDVEARGLHPSMLRGQLEAKLKDYIVSPSVTVNVEAAPMTIPCLGEVSKPGAYPIEPGAGLAEVLAVAGGLTDYASRDRIFLVRQGPAPMRIRFTYEWVVRNEGLAAAFPLRAGDLVVVE
jgi:polysaccharide export outer membrane protein